MSFTPWTQQEDEILRTLRQTRSNREIAKALRTLGFDRTKEGVRKRAQHLGIKFIAPGEVDITQTMQEDLREVVIDFAPVNAEFIYPLSTKEKTQRTVFERESTRSLYDDLQEIRKEVPRISSVLSPDYRSEKETAVLLLSDFHVGKLVDECDGTKAFNVEIAEDRILSLADKVLDATHGREQDELVILLTGDLVDGEGIYPGQEMHLEMHVCDQIRMVTKSLWTVTQQLMGQFKNIRIVTTRGNHGRSGLSDEANWDNIIYQQLELLADMEADPDLKVRNSYGNFNTCEIKGWKTLIRHNAPAQADTPASIAKFAGWYSVHHWDLMAFGHWHHWGVMTWNGKPIFRNGSLSGGDDYSEQFGACDAPTQLLFGVTDERLPSFIEPIVL